MIISSIIAFFKKILPWIVPKKIFDLIDSIIRVNHASKYSIYKALQQNPLSLIIIQKYRAVLSFVKNLRANLDAQVHFFLIKGERNQYIDEKNR